MKEHPILFNSEMVRAILDGRKTQTRRLVKPQPWWVADPSVPFSTPDADPKGIIKSPFGTVGDRLWVRETWGQVSFGKPHHSLDCFYRADGDSSRVLKWHPSIHMPRWASRINLEITAVRVERVQDITEEDAIKEGVNGGCLNCGVKAPCGCSMPRPDFRDGFAFLWQSIYDNWDTNPWVWVYTFRRVK